MAVGPAPLLEVSGVSKQFGGVRALSNVSIAVESGSIHGFVGENGAGKSTLGKIIAGVLSPNEGELRVEGRSVRYRSPRDALEDGITIVHQEITLVPRRSVMENVFLGVESKRSGFIDDRLTQERFDELNREFGMGLPAEAPVRVLSLADQKRVEILKALARRARLVVLDEPTAMLPSHDAAQLHRIVRELQKSGTTIVYVSHFLDEVLSLVDTVTVLRNGEVVQTGAAEKLTAGELVTAMLGRPLSLTFPPKKFPPADAPVVLSVNNLCRRGVLDEISLTIREGEILGVAGLVGSGRSEVARAIFGADSRDAGEFAVSGSSVDIRSPVSAIRAGIALLPEDRKQQGLLMQLPVSLNVTLPHLETLSRGGSIDLGRERRQVRDLLARVDVRPRDPAARVLSLSGGNQQKVLFAKWLFRPPRILVADEPTHGVDVGAKRGIYELISSLAQSGMGVLLISSELEEILGLAHRILVMRRGRIVGEFDGRSATEENVMHSAFGTRD